MVNNSNKHAIDAVYLVATNMMHSYQPRQLLDTALLNACANAVCGSTTAAVVCYCTTALLARTTRCGKNKQLFVLLALSLLSKAADNSQQRGQLYV